MAIVIEFKFLQTKAGWKTWGRKGVSPARNTRKEKKTTYNFRVHLVNSTVTCHHSGSALKFKVSRHYIYA